MKYFYSFKSFLFILCLFIVACEDNNESSEYTQESNMPEMVDGDIERIWDRDELCSSDDSVFIGTGVCDGRAKGVEDIGDGSHRVSSEIIDVYSKSHYFSSTIV